MIKTYNEFQIHELCKKYNIENYIINEDGSIDVNGDVNLNYSELSKIPLQFNIVTGNFDCSNNKLTTLQGSPKEVGIHFDCSNNQLTTLQGGPIKIGGSIYCDLNQLTNLEGSPEEIKYNFYCRKNKLTSLKGATKKVDGNFNCSGNLLTNLIGGPKEVGNYFCSGNKLTTLEGAPKIINGFLDYNSIDDYIISEFNYNNNNLPKCISELPIKYIVKWQEEYNIWKSDGTLDPFRWEQLKNDYQDDKEI